MPGWIWSFGGRLVDDTGLRPTATNPNNVKALAWLHDWAEPFGGRSPIPAGWGGLLNGTVAMDADSTSAVGRAINAGLKVTTGPVPHAPEGANGTWGGGQAFAIPVGSKHVTQALQFLRFLVSPDIQAERFRKYHQLLPANWDAMQQIAGELPKVYGPMLAQFPQARARTPLWIDYYVKELRPAVTAVVTGKKTPQQALTDVQQFMLNRFKEVFGG